MFLLKKIAPSNSPHPLSGDHDINNIVSSPLIVALSFPWIHGLNKLKFTLPIDASTQVSSFLFKLFLKRFFKGTSNPSKILYHLPLKEDVALH